MHTVAVHESPAAAARQAGALFCLAGLLAYVGMALPDAPDRPFTLIGGCDLLIAILAWVLPWNRWGQRSTLALALPAFVILAISSWATGGAAASSAPFFILVYAWLAVHHPPWALLAVTPFAAVAYLVPLVITARPPAVVGSAMVVVPVSTAVGLVISRRVRGLRAAHERIRAAERWRAALMMTLAHDVRGPLTIVQTSLDMLADEGEELDAASRRELTDAAVRQAERLRRLADGLLDVERVSRGTLRLDLRPVSLRPAVEEAASYLAAAKLAATAAAAVKVDIAADLTVTADPERLQQIVVNLATNALRHGAPPVVISADTDGERVSLSVRDHGPGVPAAAQPSLFQQFQAGSGEDSVGLGLWIVRELALAHGGEVRYEPAEPGARFVVTLPFASTSQWVGSNPSRGRR
jgi:signal transduction histidine kinase